VPGADQPRRQRRRHHRHRRGEGELDVNELKASIVGGPTFPINIEENINSFMVGVNYRFGAIGY
jgi:hypothetical protein